MSSINFKGYKEAYKSKKGLLVVMHNERHEFGGKAFQLSAKGEGSHTLKEVNEYLQKQVGKEWGFKKDKDANGKEIFSGGATATDVKNARVALELVAAPTGDDDDTGLGDTITTFEEAKKAQEELDKLDDDRKAIKSRLAKFEALKKSFLAAGWTMPEAAK